MDGRTARSVFSSEPQEEHTLRRFALYTAAKDWRGEPLEVGAEMWRGRAVGEIPDLSRMQAEVFVLEADAGGVAPGQRAEVALEARAGLLYRARVERVDAVPKPREQGSPVQYFGITLALEGTPQALAKPGQRVRATLFVTRRDKALVVPRQAIERAGDGHRVFVRQRDGFAPRQVELGPGNRGLVVVVKGLAAGEVIALRPPGSVAGDGKAGAGKGDEGGRAAPTVGGKSR